MSLAAKLVLALAILVGGMALGIKWEKGQQAVRDLVERDQVAKETQRRLDRGDTAAGKYEADRARIRTEYVTVTERVDHVVQNPAYGDSCLDADGLRVLSDAIRGTEAAGQPAPALPGPAAAR